MKMPAPNALSSGSRSCTITDQPRRASAAAAARPAIPAPAISAWPGFIARSKFLLLRAPDDSSSPRRSDRREAVACAVDVFHRAREDGEEDVHLALRHACVGHLYLPKG